MSPTYSEEFQKSYMQRRKGRGREEERESERKRIYLDFPWTSELGQPTYSGVVMSGPTLPHPRGKSGEWGYF